LNPRTTTSILVLAAVVFAWFSPWWIGGNVLAPLDLQNEMMSPWRAGNETEFAKNHFVSDGVSQYLVYRIIAAENYATEGWVGWSSLTYGGTAQHANTMALYYDWTMQLHRWFDFWTAWHLGLMGQVLLAACGMFFFLRGRNIGHLWAVCGGIAFAANSQIVTWLYHRWALGSFCWLPWILWSIDQYRRGHRSSWGLVPVFIAMAFLGGTLQHAALAVLAVAAMWLEETGVISTTLKRRNPSTGKSAILQTHLPQQARLFGRYAAWGVLGAGLAGIMLLPCIDAFLTSNRLGLHTGMTANAETSIYPQGPWQPLLNLAAYPFQIFPSLLGRCGSLDLMKLFKSDLFYIVYFGSLPVLIAYLSFFRKDSPPLARLLIWMGLLLPLTPLVRFLYQRLLILFIIGGVLAFVHFMQHASRQTKRRAFTLTCAITGLASLAWLSISALLAYRTDLGDSIRDKFTSQGGGTFGFFSDWIALRADRFVGDLFIWSPHQLFPLLLLLAALLGLKWCADSNNHWRTRGAFLVTLAVLCELTLFGSRWVVWADPTQHPLFPETAETRALKSHVGKDGRVTTLIHPTAHMAVTPFVPNTLSAYGIASITGYDSIIPDGMILPNDTPGDAAKLGRLGVSHLITWHGNPEVPKDWQQVWSSPSMDLYQNPLSIPRYAGFASHDAKDGFFSGTHTPWIDLTETLGLENNRRIHVPPGVLWVRIAENHADGWTYRIPEKSTNWQPIQRASDASMLLHNPTPETPTLIEMRYNPPMRTSGILVSAISLAIVSGFSLAHRKTTTRER
jgi:hypothetical protein